MAKWKDDIASRLWRSEVALRISGEPLDDFAALEAEVRIYHMVYEKLKAKDEAA